jgi:hypothetical protein
MDDQSCHEPKPSSETLLFLPHISLSLKGDKMNKTKALLALTISILVISSLVIAVESVAAKPADHHSMGVVKNIVSNFSHRLTQASWIRLNGNISQWGTTDVKGTLQTQAVSQEHQTSGSKQFTTATAIWTTNTSRAIQSVQSKENFTYTYYVARLTNASVSTLDANSTTGTYYLNGTWTISEITSTITVSTDVNGTITRVHRDQDITPTQAYGELAISSNQFTLSINGQEQLSGSVYRSVTRSWFNPFKMSDASATNTVTHTDVKTIAKCYGAMPGWGNYDQGMDFNENYRVDIADISTVAANM